MNYAQEIANLIDRKRRDCINKDLPISLGETSHMYYEGRRVAYEECQNIALAFASIKDPTK